jgi:hypothetical protein
MLSRHFVDILSTFCRHFVDVVSFDAIMIVGRSVGSVDTSEVFMMNDRLDFNKYTAFDGSIVRFVGRSGLLITTLDAVVRGVAEFESLVGLPEGYAINLRYPFGSFPVVDDSDDVRSLFKGCLLNAGFDSVEYLGSGVARFAFRVGYDQGGHKGSFVLKYEFSTFYGPANVNEVMCSLTALADGGGHRIARLLAWGARWIVSEFVEFGSYGEGSDIDYRFADYLRANFSDEKTMVERILSDSGVQVRDLHPENLRRRDRSFALVLVDLGHCLPRIDMDESDLFDWGVVDGVVTVRTDPSGHPLS